MNPDSKLLQQIAERTGLASSYLSIILQRLAQRGVLDSRRGANGGYRLSRPAGGVSLAELVAASEPAGTAPRPCMIEARGCDCARPCSMHRFVARPEGALRRRLKTTTLATLGAP